MIALLQQQLRDRRRRGHAGCKRVAGNAAFQHRHVLLERHARRILRARVFEAFVFAEAFLNVGGGLIDRNGDGAGGGIRFLAGMDASF